MASSPIGTFNYPTAYRIGCGRLRELGTAASELGMRHPLVVTDPGIRGLPWFAPAMERLTAAGLEYGVWSDVHANPTGSDVAEGVAVYKRGRYDGVILLGGGSAMDAGKCVALLADNEGGVFDYEDAGDNWKRADPNRVATMIAVPTTAGTGSEVGRGAVIVDERDHSKKIIFHPRMQPGLVIADPELTFDLPPAVTAATGMDALAHCFEAYCAPGYHPMADGIALEGMRLIAANLPRVLLEPKNPWARTDMMMAASMGATAFQKGLGLVHALSHPLGGATGLHHGTANAIFLPYVMVYNREVIEPAMDRLAGFLELPERGFEGVLRWVVDLRSEVGMPHTLAGVEGFDADLAKRLAPMAARDPSLQTNPRPCAIEDLERVFLKAWRGDLS